MAARNKLLVLNAGSSSLKFKLFQLLGQGAPAARTSGRGSAATSSGGASAGGCSEADAREAAATAAGLHDVASGLCERIGDPAGGAVMKASAGSCCCTAWRLDAQRSYATHLTLAARLNQISLPAGGGAL